jgi:hypothetical protein
VRHFAAGRPAGAVRRRSDAKVRDFDAEQAMALHQASGRWRLGLAMAMVTALSWATLPVALKITLEQLDPYTLTWFRFLVAAGAMAIFVGARGAFASFAGLGARRWGLLALAALA